MINKIFLADLFQRPHQDQTFRDMQFACHRGYFEVVILTSGYISKTLWKKKSPKETFEQINFDRPTRGIIQYEGSRALAKAKRMKTILEFLDENCASYDIGVSFSVTDDPPYRFTIGLCLDSQGSVLLRMM